MSTKSFRKVLFSFDLGHASIGWSALSMEEEASIEPTKVLGSGVVLFRADDCLTSKRRAARGLRRNIRSRRCRIERLGKYLVEKGVISEEERMTVSSFIPYFLAFRGIQAGVKLKGKEIWDVLRWYAHNRGYDGNSAWSGQRDNESEDSKKESQEDSKREKAATDKMRELGTSTMCETVMALLKIEELEDKGASPLSSYSYKKSQMAFPRNVVEREVRALLKNQSIAHPSLTEEVVSVILDDISPEERKTLAEKNIATLPRRYRGGLLFGQLIPRFDNRIIASCPLMWTNVYEQALSEGKSPEQAKKEASKFSKVGSADSLEFYQYRFARILSNLRWEGEPLSSEVRQKLLAQAQKKGFLTSSELKSIIEEECGKGQTNVTTYFELHPDSQEALVLDPALKLVSSEKTKSKKFLLWGMLPEPAQKVFLSKLRKGRGFTLLEVKVWLEKQGFSTEAQVLEVFVEAQKDATSLWKERWESKKTKGRAPYAKPILKQVVEEVLAGYDSTRPAQSEAHPEGEVKEKDGVLYALQDPSSSVTQHQKNRALAELTNNHLVRHRLTIFERLLQDMIVEFAGGNSSLVSEVVVEVGREMSEFSGKTNKQIAQELGIRQADFKRAVEMLEQKNQEIIDAGGSPLKMTGGLIRKCRIAQDIGWRCPFTGKFYDVLELPSLEREHIIPHSKRKSDSLSSLVLTWPEVNRMKGARTAKQFIMEEGGKLVVDREEMSIMTLPSYEEFLKTLKIRGGHKSDENRRKTRLKFLKIGAIGRKDAKVSHAESSADDNEELGFTEGAMTQSSHLMKLARGVAQKLLPKAEVLSLPGFVTGAMRKEWNLLECLVDVCPEVLTRAKTQEEGDLARVAEPVLSVLKDKSTIRGITHLHHAVDALTLGLIILFVPGHRNGNVWRLLAERSKDRSKTLMNNDPSLARIYRLDSENRAHLRELPAEVKEQVRQSLWQAQGRVVEHVPARMSGAKLEENMKRIVAEEDGKIRLKSKKGDKSELVVRVNKVAGVPSRGLSSKLSKVKAGLVVAENYGLALDPSPKVIPHINVYQQLQELRRANGGKPVRILRLGMIIELKNPKDSKRKGFWKVKSIKDDAKKGVVIDLQRPIYAYPTAQKMSANWRDVYLSSLLRDKFEILERSYTGCHS